MLDLVLSLCITSVGFWRSLSQVKVHTVNTYLVEVAYDICRRLNLPLDYCRTSSLSLDVGTIVVACISPDQGRIELKCVLQI